MPCNDGYGPSYPTPSRGAVGDAEDSDDEVVYRSLNDEWIGFEEEDEEDETPTVRDALSCVTTEVLLAFIREERAEEAQAEFEKHFKDWKKTVPALAQMDNLGGAAEAACDAMRVVEEYALLDEVRSSTLTWHQEHKEIDGQRKGKIVHRVRQQRRLKLHPPGKRGKK